VPILALLYSQVTNVSPVSFDTYQETRAVSTAITLSTFEPGKATHMTSITQLTRLTINSALTACPFCLMRASSIPMTSWPSFRSHSSRVEVHSPKAPFVTHKRKPQPLVKLVGRLSSCSNHFKRSRFGVLLKVSQLTTVAEQHLADGTESTQATDHSTAQSPFTPSSNCPRQQLYL
jgi:hypothetical protein